MVQSKIDQFLAQFKTIKFRTGKNIIESTKSNPEGIYFLRSGVVKQYSLSEQGLELTVHLYQPGSYFPMTWGFANIPNRHFFQAMTPVEIIIVPKQVTLKFFESNPELIFDFSKRILNGVDGLVKRLEIDHFGKAYLRVVSILLYLTKHFGVKEEMGITLNQKFTHAEIASLVGVTREHVSLEIEKLEKKGLLIYKNHIINIPSLANLENELEI